MIAVIGLFVVAVVEGSLAVGVLRHNVHRPVNRCFSAFAGTIAMWAALLGLLQIPTNPAAQIIIGRTTFAAAALIPVTFFRFARVFPDSGLLRGTLVQGVTLTGLFIAGLAFSPWILADVRVSPGLLQPSYGPLHAPFAFYFVGCFAWALIQLARKLRHARGFGRAQLQYMFVGVVLAILGGATTNLVVPLLLGTSRFSLYGPYFTLIWLGFIAHSIVRYRLMDIRVAISRSVAYAAGWVVTSGLVVGGGVLLSSAVQGADRGLSPVVAVWLGLIAATCFIALVPYMKRLADRYLHRPAYDPRQLVRDASRVVAMVTDPESVGWALTGLIDKALRPESIALVLEDPERTEFRPAFLHHVDAAFAWQGQMLTPSSPLVRVLRKRREALSIDELSRTAAPPELEQMVHGLRVWGAEVAVPVHGDRELVAILLLGARRSGDPYFRDDLDLLETLASQLAIGLANAKLYHQVLSIKEYNERILAHMDSGVVAVRDDGTVTTFNAAAERSTGLPAHEIVGRSVESLDPAIQDALKGSLAGQPDAEAEITVARPDGHALPLLIHTSALHDTGGQIRGAIAVFTDHSRLKALEEDKRRTERLAAVGALASGIAHEIRNPLVAIKTFAELLPERANDEEFRSTFAKVATKEIHRIEELLGQLRALATPTASSRTPVNLSVPVSETLELLRGEADRRGVQLIAEVPSELPAVVGEASQLKQLFVNLALNGLDAMASGGRLTVTLETSQDGSGHRLVTARITDTGAGIPRAELSRIFEPFFTTKAHGTGLGLAICRGIADAHRAALWAEPGPNGVGTAFVVQFPAMVNVHVAEMVG